MLFCRAVILLTCSDSEQVSETRRQCTAKGSRAWHNPNTLQATTAARTQSMVRSHLDMADYVLDADNRQTNSMTSTLRNFPGGSP